MGLGNVYLSHEGYEKLRRDLEQLKTSKRREISKAIGEARAHGDLSENAEYTYAKEAQGLNEKKIAELASKVKGFVVPELNMGQIVYEVERCAAGRCKTRLVPHAGGEIHDPADIYQAIQEVAK